MTYARRSRPLWAVVFGALLLLFSSFAQAEDKVLRWALADVETGFDPVQVQDLYSRQILANIFDAPLHFRWFDPSHGLEPNTLAEMPTVSPDFRTFTFHLKPGIYFAPDPAFQGKKRELTADDYVYSLKRIYDPHWKSIAYGSLAQYNIASLEALRQEAIKTGHFDYDRPVAGVRALDRYTWQVLSGTPSPRFATDNYGDPAFGVVAREVVERYGDEISEHPVGTGPFMLAEWVRASHLALVRNPNYRLELYHIDPAPGDTEAEALALRFNGRPTPFVDRVEIGVIEESQPRWLSFLNGEFDLLNPVPADLVNLALPNNRLAPNLKRKKLRSQRLAAMRSYQFLFNMEDPTVGGYSPAQVALRRAIALGLDAPAAIGQIFKYQAIPAQSIILPGQVTYDPTLRSEMGTTNLDRARALLDVYGFVPHQGGPWRDTPDGKPLVVHYMSRPDQLYRNLDEIVQRSFDSLGIRLEIETHQFSQDLKAVQAGHFTTWIVGQSASGPDPGDALTSYYGPQRGAANLSRFALPQYDSLYEQQDQTADGPKRIATIKTMSNLVTAYMPSKLFLHPLLVYLWYPRLVGYRADTLISDWWRYVDVDESASGQL